jgi:hypothetical protein
LQALLQQKPFTQWPVPPSICAEQMASEVHGDVHTSALGSATPLPLTPPASSTAPLASTVELCRARPTSMVATIVVVFDAGS